MPTTKNIKSTRAKALVKRDVKPEKKVKTRDRILGAAATLFSEYGYGGTSISMILERSNTSPTSLYGHFGSKEDLFVSVIEQGAAHFFEFANGLRSKIKSAADLHHVRKDIEKTMAKDPTFLRCIIATGLSGRVPSKRIGDTIARVRKEGSALWLAQIRHALEGLDAKVIGLIAKKYASVGVVLFDGAFVAHGLDPKFDIDALLSSFQDALRALGEKHSQLSKQKK